MNAMKFGNVVLLGSSRANPWVELIQSKLNFRYAMTRLRITLLLKTMLLSTESQPFFILIRRPVIAESPSFPI